MHKQINSEITFFQGPFLKDEFPYEINRNLLEINCELFGAESQSPIDSDSTVWRLIIKYDPNLLVHEFHETLLDSFPEGDIKIINQINEFMGANNMCLIEILYKS